MGRMIGLENSCPLCHSKNYNLYAIEPLKRKYFKCLNCFLVYVSSANVLDFSEQKKRYDFHQNNIENLGYIAFLQKAILPALEFLPNSGLGLDFGSGPGSGHIPNFDSDSDVNSSPTSKSQNGSVLSILLQRDYGFTMDCYDPVYCPWDKGKWFESGEKYDFIFSTEVWEHFSEPCETIESITELLKKNGILVIMTTPWSESIDFESWYYAKDDTHVCFFHEKTMEWIANWKNLTLLSRSSNSVWIFKKNQ